MAAGWRRKNWEPLGGGPSFKWTSELVDSLRDEEQQWPFELLSPEGKLMHMSESEELDGFIRLEAPPVNGYYDMGYVDEDGGWWWVGLRNDAGGRCCIVARQVSREEAGDRIIAEFDRGSAS